MKTVKIWTVLVPILVFGTSQLIAQDTIQVVKSIDECPEKIVVNIKKRTIMQQFEPEMVISSEERMEMKKKRISDYFQRKKILDTLDISDAKRKKLMHDLRTSPNSDRLSKAFVDIEFED